MLKFVLIAMFCEDFHGYHISYWGCIDLFNYTLWTMWKRQKKKKSKMFLITVIDLNTLSIKLHIQWLTNNYTNYTIIKNKTKQKKNHNFGDILQNFDANWTFITDSVCLWSSIL